MSTIEDAAQVMELLDSGLSYSAVCTKLGKGFVHVERMADIGTMVRHLDSGLSVAAVAHTMGRSVWWVRLLAKEAGYRFNAGPAPKVGEQRLRELAEQGLSLKEMAAVFGVSYSTVRVSMQRYGIPRRSVSEAKRAADAKGRGNTVLTEDQVTQLRALASGGMSHTELGRRFGISRTAARAAADGESWGHIPVPVCTEIGEVDAAE